MLTIRGFKFKHREDEGEYIFIFSISAKKLLEHSNVEIVQRDTVGIQRILYPSRVKKVTSFFDDTGNESNIIPNSIVVSIEKDPTESNDTTLKFDCESDEKFITIIDGQHRLEGIAKSKDNLNILVSAFIKPSLTDKAFQFVVINNKSHKVPTTHVKSLLANYHEIDNNLLSEKLNRVGVSFSHIPDIDLVDTESSSPLEGLIKWQNNEDGIIPINAIENSFWYILDKVPEAKEDDAIKRDILYQIWNAVQEHFSDIWETRDNNHLFEKAPFIVLTSILVDYAFTYCDILSDLEDDEISIMDENIFFKSTKMYLKKFPKEFWTKEWTKKGLDTNAGRVLIKNSIYQIKANIRNKEEDQFKDIDVLT